MPLTLTGLSILEESRGVFEAAKRLGDGSNGDLEATAAELGSRYLHRFLLLIILDQRLPSDLAPTCWL